MLLLEFINLYSGAAGVSHEKTYTVKPLAGYLLCYYSKMMWSLMGHKPPWEKTH